MTVSEIIRTKQRPLADPMATKLMLACPAHALSPPPKASTHACLLPPLTPAPLLLPAPQLLTLLPSACQGDWAQVVLPPDKLL